MTTIVATREGLWADSLVTHDVPFEACKLYQIGNSIYGIAGSLEDGLKFLEYLRSGANEEDLKNLDMDASPFLALEVSPRGIFLWRCSLVGVPIESAFHAIGSGALLALAAMDFGHNPVEAIRYASTRDINTNDNVKFLPCPTAILKAKKPRKKNSQTSTE